MTRQFPRRRDEPATTAGPPGLREFKKSRTRQAIRREAIRLFDEQGFASTTVEQIAEAADVSPRTFYRYFRMKEAVLLSDDHVPWIIEAFIAAPAELAPVAAYRHAVASVYGALPADDRREAVSGQQLMYTVPEARGLVYDEYVRLVDLIVDVLSQRSVAPAGAAERRVLAGAIVGVLIATSHDNPHPAADLLCALDHLDRMFGAPNR